MNDLTGRKQFARNVIVTWTAHIFILIAGFVLPRQISDNLGAEALGIWDLGWATVRYLSLTNMGFGSALTRYSAMYLANKDYEGLSKAYTAVTAWQITLAIFVVAASAVFAWSLSYWLEVGSSTDLTEAQLVLFLLGLSLAIRMLGASAAGIIAGCHRWDIQNSLTAGRDFILAAVLILIMILEGDLIDMAWAVVLSTVVVTIIRHLYAKKLAPEAKIHFQYFHVKISIKMLRFGTKSQLGGAPQLIIFQTIAILLAGQAGPAALAIFNRAAALVRHCDILIKKITMMFTPMVSSLIGLENQEAAKKQLLQASQYSMCLTLPVLLGIFWFGDLFILLWMGPEYANQTMVQILAAGAMLPIAQTGTISVLAGLNAHGKVTLTNMLITVVTLAILSALCTLYFSWSEVSAAVIAGLAWTLGTSTSILYYLRRLFHISPFSYLLTSILIPLICNAPLFFLFWYSSIAMRNHDWWIAAFAIFAGGILTLLIYWLAILTGKDRKAIVGKITRRNT